MSKEMIVASSTHETKLAILEDNQVMEVYFEREKEYGLAGSICKGRVTRVLPGMQSAFVDVGLERDAFLYVSDFLEDTEEYDKIVTTVEDRVIRMQEGQVAEPATAGGEPSAPFTGGRAEPDLRAGATPAAVPLEQPERAKPVAPAESSSTREPAAGRPSYVKAPEGRPPRGAESPEGRPPGSFSRRGRHRRHGKGFPESKYSRRPSGAAPPPPPPSGTVESAPLPVILPGESLAKYRDRSSSAAAPTKHDAEAALESFSPAEELEAGAPPTAEPIAREERTPAWGAPEIAGEVPAATPRVEAEEGRSEPEREASEAVAAEAWPVSAGVVEEARSVPPEAAAEPERVAPPQFAPEFAPLPTSSAEQTGQTDAQVFAATDAAEDPLGLREPFSAESPLELAPELPTTEGEPSTAEPMPAPTAEPEAADQAVVREGGRNPRYQRKSRWGRREGREETAPRPSRPREREAPKPMIADLLKEGQEIIVQIAKEPLGKKGARITSHIALPGRYLVYMPTVDHIGVSRKIASEEERHRLKRIILEHRKNIPGGFIVRTAGEGRREEDLRQDIRYLASLWAEIKTQAEKAKAPALLHHDLDLVLRTLRDQLSDEFSAVWVDNEQEYEKMVSLVHKFQPALVHRVKLYTKDVPLFEEMGIQDEINKALKPKVWLKSGGYIVINQTEALVAIDVNTGKYVGRSNRLEDTIVRTNVEAIQEIVRQIRLRDLGGIIVIDFIDMDERKNRQKVMGTLEDELKGDRSPSKILAFNEFGLVAITRKRVRQPLERTLCQPCPDCGGSGFVKSVATVCLEIVAEARKIASELGGKQITLRVNPEVGKALKGRDNSILAEIEEITGKAVVIRNDPLLHQESFTLE